ncbi:MAG TPA: pre-16S rRNA-processing nuclease YqgF [Armatimonadota bacterium]|jgi:RNase H-fold protein (predicted Holliday junction resolvase)
MQTQSPLLAIDPGRGKCGLAVVTFKRDVLDREIVQLDALPLRVSYFVGKYGVETIVLGDRTGAKDVRNMLRASGWQLDIVFVDEHRTSELGRRRYLQAHPGKGWKRLLPIGLREPDRPYDDYVAVILAERYLDGMRSTRIRSSR